MHFNEFADVTCTADPTGAYITNEHNHFTIQCRRVYNSIKVNEILKEKL